MNEPVIRIHHLKIVEPYYTAVLKGLKTFEIRNNDRDFRCGDWVTLWPYCPKKKMYTTATPIKEKVITYVTDYEQKEGYVVFAMR